MSLRVSLAEPGELDAATRSAIGALLRDSSPSGLNRYTWDNSVHSVHVIGTRGDELVAHGLLSRRTVWIDGRRLRSGHQEMVAVAEEWRGYGYGRRVSDEMEALIRAECDLGTTAVDPGVAATLETRGWRGWLGTTWVRHGDELTRTPEHDGRVLVLSAADPCLEIEGEIAINWRDGEVW